MFCTSPLSGQGHEPGIPMGFRLQHPKEQCCSIKGAQPRAGRGRRELCCQDLGRVPAGELPVSHPAECLPNTSLEEHIGHENQISEGWVSYPELRASQPGCRGCTGTGGAGCPSSLLQLHQLPVTLCQPLCISCTSSISHSLLPKKFSLQGRGASI